MNLPNSGSWLENVAVRLTIRSFSKRSVTLLIVSVLTAKLPRSVKVSSTMWVFFPF